jgi:hypothetical protein
MRQLKTPVVADFVPRPYVSGEQILCHPSVRLRTIGNLVMPGLVPGIHVFFLRSESKRRGWPGQARP